MKAKKIIVAVDLEHETYKPLKALSELNLEVDAEIHLVHVFPVIIYAMGMNLTAQTQPTPEERPRIQDQVTAALKDLQKEILPRHKNVVFKCLFDSNTKAAFTDYVTAEKADLVIVATRGKHGIKNFFDSSFAQHQIKYSPANVLVLR